MKQNHQETTLEFTGKTFLEYLATPDSECCSICSRVDGEESVVLVNGVETLGHVKIVHIITEGEGFEYRFPICTEHLEMFKGLTSMGTQYFGNTIDDLAIVKP